MMAVGAAGIGPGDEVIVRTPEGKVVWYVNSIDYRSSEAER
jgi:transcription elongation GreA/GreB family factor